MTKGEQQKVNIPMKLVGFGIMSGKLRSVTVRREIETPYQGKKERLFAIPEGGTRLIFGGIFEIDYEKYAWNLHSYFHNSIPFINKTITEDLFDIVDVGIRPIKFKSFNDIKLCNYEVGNEVMCLTFIGNQANRRIQFNSRNKEYKRPGIDKENFIQMIKDKQEEYK